MQISPQHDSFDMIAQLIQTARVRWQGCDWPTQFGLRMLDLNGIRSRQAKLAAKATRGEESACWAAATAWLAEVEGDAKKAASLAEKALDEAKRRCWDSANDLMRQAESLESKYGQLTDYRHVREALQRWFESESLPA